MDHGSRGMLTRGTPTLPNRQEGQRTMKQLSDEHTTRIRGLALLLAMLGLASLHARVGHAEQPPPPCHRNPRAASDMEAVANRDDIRGLPAPLKDRLVRLAGRPHSFLPIQAFAEADKPSQLFQYYLLDTTGFEPNVFTTRIPGVNDAVELSVTGANCGLPTIGAVRVVLEPKPGLPTDPNDPNAFIDVFTDIDPLFVINNESGWYEGWMIHDLTVPNIAPPRSDGTGAATFATITAADAAALESMGAGSNVPGSIFTMDGPGRALPECVGSLSRRADQRRAPSGEYGGIQRHAAERRALILGVQLPGNELDPSPL